MSKPKKSPTLNVADLRLIREIVQQECLPLNKENRKKLRDQEKEIKRLQILVDGMNERFDDAYQKGYNAGARAEYESAKEFTS